MAATLLDVDRRILAWNPASERLFGWSADEARSRTIDLIADQARHGEQDAAFEWVDGTGEPLQYEAVRRQADGTPVTLRIWLVPLTERGTRLGYLAVAVEQEPTPEEAATANSHTVAELRARNGELARTAAHLEAELQEVKQVNQRLRRFARAASHDLAQPLSALAGHLELLEELGVVAGDERARALVAAARRSHRAVVEALEASARHADARPAVQRTSLAQLVADVATAISPTIRAAEADIQVDQQATVDVDPDVFARALQNLLVNSCRYRHPDRPLRIAVRYASARDVDLVRLVDNGRGFAPGEHQRVFEEGYRGHAGADRPGSGTGLATVRSIVEDLGGRVWAEDTPGGGATVVIALPRTEDPDEAGAAGWG